MDKDTVIVKDKEEKVYLMICMMFHQLSILCTINLNHPCRGYRGVWTTVPRDDGLCDLQIKGTSRSGSSNYCPYYYAYGKKKSKSYHTCKSLKTINLVVWTYNTAKHYEAKHPNERRAWNWTRISSTGQLKKITRENLQHAMNLVKYYMDQKAKLLKVTW